MNHRPGLYDAVLDQGEPLALAGGVGEATRRGAGRGAGGSAPWRWSAPRLDEVAEALAAGAARLLLDNMAPDRAAARRVDRVAGRADTRGLGRGDAGDRTRRWPRRA